MHANVSPVQSYPWCWGEFGTNTILISNSAGVSLADRDASNNTPATRTCGAGFVGVEEEKNNICAHCKPARNFREVVASIHVALQLALFSVPRVAACWIVNHARAIDDHHITEMRVVAHLWTNTIANLYPRN